jgi:hypothetical protein
MKQIKAFYAAKVTPVLRPVAVFLIILGSAAPVGKAIGIMVYGWICGMSQPTTMYEDVFVMIGSAFVGVMTIAYYMSAIYRIMKKHFETV